VSRWIVALIISAAGLAAGSDVARAVSLEEAIASFLNASAHPPAKGEKPTERSAERPQERVVKHPRLKHSHEGKPPAVTVTVHTPVEHERQPAPPVSAKMPADGPGLVLPVADPLKPHSVQTFTVSPSTAPPVVGSAAEPKERPATNIGREALPRLAAATAVVEEDEEPPITSLADTSGSAVRYDAILLDLLLLTLVAGALMSINSRTPARMPVLLRPSLRGRLRPLLAEIDRPSWIRRLFHRTGLARPNSAGQADARSASTLAPPWDVTWDSDFAPARTPIAWPAPRANKDEAARPERTLPELEDQLARIVRDQIVVPLRKAS
jgi:hypothetical protein